MIPMVPVSNQSNQECYNDGGMDVKCSRKFCQ
jgi:hypothetical protein